MMLWVLGKKGQAGYGRQVVRQAARGEGRGKKYYIISSKDCSGSLHAHSKGDVDREGK